MKRGIKGKGSIIDILLDRDSGDTAKGMEQGILGNRLLENLSAADFANKVKKESSLGRQAKEAAAAKTASLGDESIKSIEGAMKSLDGK
jgi:hypothetical protein